jgi:hypothetical protein
MIGPGADAIQPGFEQLELGLAEFADDALQHEHREYFFLQHIAVEKLIGNLDKVMEIPLRKSGPSKAHGNLAQLAGIPAARGAVPQHATDVFGDIGGGFRHSKHQLPTINFRSSFCVVPKGTLLY